MRRIVAGFCLLVLSCGSALSDPPRPSRTTNPLAVQMLSAAGEKTYGLLLRAPRAGCRRVRYRIETAGRVLLGKTPVLLAGQLAVVRIGTGFSLGPHVLVVVAEGCKIAPSLLRQVVLHKASPDHGWRAAPAMTLVAFR